MHTSKCIVSSLVLSMTLWSGAFAAQPTAPAQTTPVRTAPSVAPAEVDCQKVGGDVSALIDTASNSPNISAAKAVFQRGIMDCMEGDDDAANKLYQEAKRLLTNGQPRLPASKP